MKRYKNKFLGEEFVHFEGVANMNDLTLCGWALEGEEELGDLTECHETSEKVTCPNCIAIVKFCKKIRRTEFIDEESDT